MLPPVGSSDAVPPPVSKPSLITDARLWKLGKDSDALSKKAIAKYKQIFEKGAEKEPKFQADIGKLREQRDRLFIQKQKLEKAYGGLTSEKKAQQLLQVTKALADVEKLCQEAEKWQSTSVQIMELNETIEKKTVLLKNTKEQIAKLEATWSEIPEEMGSSTALPALRTMQTQLKDEINKVEQQIAQITTAPAAPQAVNLAEAGGATSTPGRVDTIGQRVLSSRQFDEARLHMSTGVQAQEPTADRAGYYLHERVDRLMGMPAADPAHLETMQQELLARSSKLVLLDGPQRKMHKRLTSRSEQQVADAPPLTKKETTLVRGLLAKSLAEIHVETTFPRPDPAQRDKAIRDFETIWSHLNKDQQRQLFEGDEQFKAMFDNYMTKSGSRALKLAVADIRRLQEAFTPAELAEVLKTQGQDTPTWKDIYQKASEMGHALVRGWDVHSRLAERGLGHGQPSEHLVIYEMGWNKLREFLAKGDDGQGPEVDVEDQQIAMGSEPWEYLRARSNFLLAFGTTDTQKENARRNLDIIDIEERF